MVVVVVEPPPDDCGRTSESRSGDTLSEVSGTGATRTVVVVVVVVVELMVPGAKLAKRRARPAVYIPSLTQQQPSRQPQSSSLYSTI